ncbi:MAG TPA: cytochrome d ubiquinol oxidase subunit II [Candidatus Solibacter sp.]|jgi:cytochrome d ubiquinol oxidase subunit II
METIWFCLVAVMLAIYVVLDGFDLGAGVAHLLIARTDAERRLVLRSIGPVWDGNEVWLLAAGGTLFFAFPALYASSFSGFYLPLMIVLWLLILRGISIEFRNHIESLVWHPLWDAVFAGSSALLAIFFGAALGNVVRGVPLDQAGDFFLPLWTNFSPGQDAGILDWYTILIALAALLTLTVHGALWIALKNEGTVEQRARSLASRAWWGILAAVIAITLVSFRIQPHLQESFTARPWCYIFPLIALVGLIGMKLMNAALRVLDAFVASCLFIVGMLCSVAAGLYPYVLPSNADPARSLTIVNSAAPRYGLEIGLMWFIPGILLTTAYFFYTYRSFAGKLR